MLFGGNVNSSVGIDYQEQFCFVRIPCALIGFFAYNLRVVSAIFGDCHAVEFFAVFVVPAEQYASFGKSQRGQSVFGNFTFAVAAHRRVNGVFFAAVYKSNLVRYLFKFCLISLVLSRNVTQTKLSIAVKPTFKFIFGRGRGRGRKVTLFYRGIHRPSYGLYRIVAVFKRKHVYRLGIFCGKRNVSRYNVIVIEFCLFGIPTVESISIFRGGCLRN